MRIIDWSSDLCTSDLGDGVLHRGGQYSKKHHPHLDFGIEQSVRQKGQCHPKNREKHISAGKHSQMEPPNRKSADNRFPRQFCAVHEEQENYGGRCCPFEKYRGLSPARQQACNQHRRDEKNREDIRAETKHQIEQRLMFNRGGLTVNRTLARALLKGIVTVLDLIFFKKT